MTGPAQGGGGCSACHLPPTFSLAANSQSNGLDAGETRIVHEKHGCWDQPWLNHADAVAVLDTGSWGQLADARRWLEPRAAMTVPAFVKAFVPDLTRGL